MQTVLYPAVQNLARAFLSAALTEFGKPMPVSTKNPAQHPERWVRIESMGGNRTLWSYLPLINLYVYDYDEVTAEQNSNRVHSLMLDAPGVDIQVPEYPQPFKWVTRAQHISGPSSVKDEDIPDLEVFRTVVTWRLHPIP